MVSFYPSSVAELLLLYEYSARAGAVVCRFAR